MIGRPGSVTWLLRHDLRLDWRRRSERRGAGRWVAIAVTLTFPLFLGLAVGRPVGLLLADLPDPVTPIASASATLALVGLTTLMLSQAISTAVEALYERGDLDLLFASPLPPTRIVLVRALGIAFSTFSPFGFFVAGPVVGIALTAGPAWLSGLVVLFALALGATGLALVLSLGLLRRLGARRTRWVAQGVAAAIGALLFLSGQTFNMVAPGGAMSLWRRFLGSATAPGSAPRPMLTWGLRAIMGEPLPFVTVAGAGLLLFLAGVAWAGPRFAAGLATAAGAGAGGGRARSAPFRAGVFAALYRKEMRLLLRDPMLIPQVVLRLVYLVPLAALTARYAVSAEMAGLAGALLAMVLMANQVTGSLAWMTISGEEAPAVLLTSPADPRIFALAKLLAAATPAAAVLVPAVAYLAWRSPQAGAIALLGCVAALVSAGLVNLVWQRPAPRSEFRRRRNSSWFVTLIELGQGLLIAGAAALLVQRLPVGLVPAACAAIGLALLVRAATRRPGLLGPPAARRAKPPSLATAARSAST